jgi:hypothetical protein
MSACVIDWHAFGLAGPIDVGCTGAPIVVVMQVCGHGHVAAAKVCGPHLSEFTSYGDAADWTCGPCLTAGHQCLAPLKVINLDAAPDREVVDRLLAAAPAPALRKVPSRSGAGDERPLPLRAARKGER